MSISPLNGGTIIQFPRTQVVPMALNQVPSMTVNSATAAAVHAAAQAQQRMAVTDSTIAKRNATNAQKRANHNAIERARRECLNSKFQELARSIPALSQVRRPSKSVIVQKSLDYIYGSKKRSESRKREIRSIKNENVSLREEVNRLRKSLGMAPLPERPVSVSPEPEEFTDSDHFDTEPSTPRDFSTPDTLSSDDMSDEQVKEDENEDSDSKIEVNQQPEEEQQSKTSLPMITPNYIAIGQNTTQSINSTVAAPIPGFLDYMQSDLSNGLSGLTATDFATSSIAFPTITPAVQAVAGMDMYNSPLTLATTAAAIAAVQASSPCQPIYLPSPCEDVFNMNGLLMNSCIDQQVAIGTTPPVDSQTQTPPHC